MSNVCLDILQMDRFCFHLSKSINSESDYRILWSSTEVISEKHNSESSIFRSLPDSRVWPSSASSKHQQCTNPPVDLLQVDLLASGASLFLPRSGRPRATKSREVDLSRQKWERRDSHLGFQVSFASPWLQWRNVLILLQPNLLSVYVYLHHRRSKFVYCVRKLFLTVIFGESWRPQAAGKKTKTCFNLESILGKEISSDCFVTNILCRKKSTEQSRTRWHCKPRQINDRKCMEPAQKLDSCQLRLEQTQKHPSPTDMLRLFSFGSHAILNNPWPQEHLSSLSQSTPCWNLNRTSRCQCA